MQTRFDQVFERFTALLPGRLAELGLPTDETSVRTTAKQMRPQLAERLVEILLRDYNLDDLAFDMAKVRTSRPEMN